MSKASRWAGYLASIFSIGFFVTALVFRGSGGEVPAWFALTIGLFMTLASVSGVVCLVSGAFAYARSRRASAPAGANGPTSGLSQ
jgi:hypothetical protein